MEFVTVSPISYTNSLCLSRRMRNNIGSEFNPLLDLVHKRDYEIAMTR